MSLLQGKAQTGKISHNWKGGKRLLRGYIYTFKPDHPSINTQYGYVPEHRLVMEKFLGRYLTHEEFIHHLNGIRNDNRLENLCITDSKNHDTHSVKHFLQQRIVELEQQLKAFIIAEQV